MKKNSLFTIIIVLSIILILLLVFLNFNKSKKNQKESESQTQVEISNDKLGIKEKYECNELQYVSVGIEDLMQIYFNDYKTYALTNPKQAYELLNKEYREKRFKDLDEYKLYISNNKEKIASDNLEKYQIAVDDEKTRYICLGKYENYYIFCENSVMDYSIILDTYTIDQPEFIEKYDEANEKGKCILNIEKVKQALNSGDYKYIYGKLNEQFKNKNYSTLSTFENYMKSNLNKYNKIEYKEFKNEGETYIYNVELTDLLGKTDKTINMQILMQLKEDRDFVMSFSIK